MKSAIANFQCLILLCLLVFTSCTGPRQSATTAVEHAPFTSDKCSDGQLSRILLLLRVIPEPETLVKLDALCVEHDRAYWKGGSESERLAADEKLREGIKNLGLPEVADLYFHAVRLGGEEHWRQSYSWGYGLKKQ